MIVFTDRPGQLCNRLWSFAPFITQSLEKGNKVLILFFGEYAHLFQDLNCNKNIVFININNKPYFFLLKALFLVIRKVPSAILLKLKIHTDKLNWGKENWPQSLLNSKEKVVLLSGWNHLKNNQYLLTFHEELKKIFRPNKDSINKVNDIFLDKKKELDVVVGIHIRRGDFKNFVGGAYYFEDEIYAAKIQQILGCKELEEARVGFLLCSDEPLNVASYNKFEVFQIPDANAIEDLFALSLCDFIMGPPSTFSMWASFYGKVPLRIFKSTKESVKIADFSPIVALDKFESGEILEHVSYEYSYMNKT